VSAVICGDANVNGGAFGNASGGSDGPVGAATAIGGGRTLPGASVAGSASG
jgi:hypothetical protein